MKYKTIDEIEKRMLEVRGLLGEDDADLDALEQEFEDLKKQKRGLKDKETRRKKMLSEIAEDGTLEGMKPEARNFNPVAPEAGREEPETVFETEVYRRAFLKNMQGGVLTDAEKRTLSSASGSAGSVIPTETLNMVVHKMETIAPMLEEITLLQIPGNVSIAVEDNVTDAQAHAENADVAEDAPDKTIEVKLTGFEIIKIMSISAKVSAMSIAAFEDWLTTILAEGVARKIEDWIFNGTGTTEPVGIEKANTWNAENSVTTAAAKPTYDEVCGMIALLPAEYDSNAKMTMNKQTFWKKIMPIRDDAKAPIVTKENGQYYVMGYPVKISAKVKKNDVFLGDMKQYYGNLAAPIEVASSRDSGFRSNKIDYRGTAVFDGKPAVKQAFVKMTIKEE